MSVVTHTTMTSSTTVSRRGTQRLSRRASLHLRGMDIFVSAIFSEGSAFGACRCGTYEAVSVVVVVVVGVVVGSGVVVVSCFKVRKQVKIHVDWYGTPGQESQDGANDTNGWV